MNETRARDTLIALSLLPFLTPSRTRLLREHFDPVVAACKASAKLLAAMLQLTPEQAELVRRPPGDPAPLREQVVTIDDETYPALLREIIDPPLVLHFRGDLSLLDRPSIAVVGSRRSTPYGVNAAAQLSRQLAASGLVIVSGLARGIDAAAHQAALEAGTTIAVLGTGIDIAYPRANLPLYRKIAEQGLVVSEFPPKAPPKPEHFPIRNRVIAGLSLGTVIVEATTRSGSLITARMAAEQGREVFAVPGSIFSAGSEGTHRLVQYGAKLVHDANDVLEELPKELQLGQAGTEAPEPPPESLRDVLDVFTPDEGVHVDHVVARLGRNASAVAEALLELELGGWIRALPGARYVRVR